MAPPEPPRHERPARPATDSRRRTLTREDWIAAALEVLADSGPQAVVVERLANQLGTTKGSFYWHFTNRAALLRAAVTAWERTATDAVIASGLTHPLAEARGQASAFGDSSPDRDAQLLLNLLWHADDAAIGPVVTRILRKRLTYHQARREQAGQSTEQARAHALYAHALQLGTQLLRRATEDTIPDFATISKALE
jgi:AcrR family transcriptional regulator